RPLSCLQSAVFLLNSRSHQFIATPSSFWRRPVKLQGRTLSRSYGTNLPSSLKRLRILISPTCVGLRYGLVRLKLRGFSWNHFRLLLHRSEWPRTLESRARSCQG